MIWDFKGLEFKIIKNFVEATFSCFGKRNTSCLFVFSSNALELDPKWRATTLGGPVVFPLDYVETSFPLSPGLCLRVCISMETKARLLASVLSERKLEGWVLSGVPGGWVVFLSISVLYLESHSQTEVTLEACLQGGRWKGSFLCYICLAALTPCSDKLVFEFAFLSAACSCSLAVLNPTDVLSFLYAFGPDLIEAFAVLWISFVSTKTHAVVWIQMK